MLNVTYKCACACVWTFILLRLRLRTIFTLEYYLCVCVCIHACVCVCVCVCVCMQVCMCIMCIVLLVWMVVWCMSVLLFAYVCMLTPFWDTFCCWKTWQINTLVQLNSNFMIALYIYKITLSTLLMMVAYIQRKLLPFFFFFFIDVAVDAEKTRSRIVSQTVFEFVTSLFVCRGWGGGGGGGGGGGDNSVIRALDLWLKGHGVEFLLERQENFLLLGRFSVLTLILVSVPPLYYRSST